MSKPYSKQDLSAIFDADLTWRRKELSDLKSAINTADDHAKPPLLRAIIAMSYAHWEGYVRTCASRYFEYLTLRRKPFVELERQIYIDTILLRLKALYQSRLSLKERCSLVNDILDGVNNRFTYVSPEIVDTHSNLNTDVIRDICLVCAVDPSHFEDNREFIDRMLLKRRNAIAHGQQEFIRRGDIDDLVATTLALMASFRTLLENKVYTEAYAA